MDGTRILQFMAAVLFPKKAVCPNCEQALRGIPEGLGKPLLCGRCTKEIQELTTAFCRICGRAGQGALCDDCARQPHIFFEARAFAAYEGPVENMIKAVKYQGRRLLLPLLGDWLVQAYCRHFGADDHMILVPVPMHPTKQEHRGFNQADELARHLGRQLNLPVLSALKRVTLDRSQATQGRTERLATLHQSFAIREQDEPRDKDRVLHFGRRRRESSILGEHVLLIDDVLTTGATADACARILFRAGAVSVSVLTVAR